MTGNSSSTGWGRRADIIRRHLCSSAQLMLTWHEANEHGVLLFSLSSSVSTSCLLWYVIDLTYSWSFQCRILCAVFLILCTIVLSCFLEFLASDQLRYITKCLNIPSLHITNICGIADRKFSSFAHLSSSSFSAFD